MDDKEKRLDSENQAENNEQKAKDPLEEILESLGISKRVSDIKAPVKAEEPEKPAEEKAEEPEDTVQEEEPQAEAPQEKKGEAQSRYEQKPNVQEFRSSEKVESPVRIKRSLSFFIGVLIVIFALFGIYSVAKLSVGGIISLFDNSAKIAQYNEFLVPVVANDPEPFDDIALANSADLIDITLWAILKGDLAPDQYDYKDGAMLIPAADVEKRFASLFGTEVKPVHQTITNFGYEFVYDKADAVYKIPLTGMSPIYTPRVTDIEKKSSSIILTVAYLGGDSWTQDRQGNYIPAEPDKYMSITLREVNGEYHISAIQAKNAPETAAHTIGRAETTAAPTTAAETSAAETNADNAANDITETTE